MISSFIMAKLTALWSRASVFLSIAGAVIIALGVAFIKGRADGKATYERQRLKAKIIATKKAEAIRDDVQNSAAPRIDRRLDRWMRD